MRLKFGPYSPSRLETAICPYSFFRQYIDEDRRKLRSEGVPQARGSAVHEVFETLTAHMTSEIRNGKSTTSIPDSAVQKLVVEAINRHPAAYPESKSILDMAYSYLKNPPPELTGDAEVELRLAIKMEEDQCKECSYDDTDAFFRGRADIMVITDDTEKCYLYDHKTQPNIETADTFQLGCYALVISKVYPFLQEIHTVLHFARYGKYSKDCIWVKDHDRRKLVIEREAVNPDYVISLTDIEEELMTRIQIVENTSDWSVAIPHKNCQYCPVMYECPALKELIEANSEGLSIVKPFHIQRDTNQAVKVAGYLNVLEEVVKNLKEELKEHVAFSQTPISIPGKTYCFRSNETVDWDCVNKKLKTNAYAIFEKYGIDPRQFMSFNQTASKSVWLLGNEELLKELSKLFPKKVTSEFRGVKT